MSDPYVVLVTGSRNWPDVDPIRRFLVSVDDQHAACKLIHGRCNPRRRRSGEVVSWDQALRLPFGKQLLLAGADWLADRVASRLGWEIEAYPANWDRYRGAAGPIRNKRMVATGPDLCGAFICLCRNPCCPDREPHGSHGASGCADLADAAGIPVRRFTDA